MYATYYFRHDSALGSDPIRSITAQCRGDTALGDLVLAVEALSVDAEQHLDAACLLLPYRLTLSKESDKKALYNRFALRSPGRNSTTLEWAACWLIQTLRAGISLLLENCARTP
jgi:hypothetical protein